MQLAPIFVSVYDRCSMLKTCIESLKNCKYASESILYISSDGPKEDSSYENIINVRSYIKSIYGFKQVIPYLFDENIGPAKISRIIYKDIFSENQSVIRLEDDVIVSPDFLSYINGALGIYESNKRVFSISAFSHTIFLKTPENLKNSTYFTHRFNPWGFGIWKDRYCSAQNYDIEDVKSDLRDKGFRRRLSQIGKDILPAFSQIISDGHMIVGDYLYLYHMIKNENVTLAPYTSKTYNLGFDGLGTRTSKSKRYESINPEFLKRPVSSTFFSNIDENINDKVSRVFFNKRLIHRIKYSLYRMNLLSIGVKFHKMLNAHAKR